MTRTYKKERRRAPLSAKIFAYFAVFTAFIIVLLWLFQTVFFDAIYGAVKKHDMKNCARSITQVIDEGADTESISDATIAAAKKYNCCIIVYKIQRSNAKMISGAHIQSSCMIHGIDFAANQALFKELYYGAQNGGYCFTKLDLDGVESDKIASPETKDGAGLSSELCSALASVDGADYLVIADSQIVPLSATTRVLTYQLIAITAILFVASVVISLVISHRLSKPLKKMTAEASLLAKGNYDVHFENRGFRESVELGNTLNYAAGELSKLDSMQKELIANISHDLRTPLTMIRGYGEVMRDIPGEMNSENIQIIIDETARLSSLVTDILDLSKLTEDGVPISREVFSLTDTVRETIARYSHLIETDGFTIAFDASEDAKVYADRTKILQVVYNLIGNAINYTGPDRRVTVTQTVTGRTVRLSVTDTGAGIPEDQLANIWERYYKVSEFHNRPKAGSGLGLSIVKSILIKHDAAFGVSSTLGKGSTFWFELDLADGME